MTLSFGTTRPAFVGEGSAQTRLQHCASSSNSHTNGTPFSTSAFIDFEKTFDSPDQQSLWKLLGQYDMPEKITSIIRNSYSGMTPTGRFFQVKTVVTQGCLLLPFLFLLVLD